ncbi:rRNA maturation RNase YbeY [Chloroflexota bacterium]
MDRKSSARLPCIDVRVQIAPDFAGDLSPHKLKQIAEASLHHEGRTGQATLVITDDQGIQTLNRDFLGIDVPTDVLAFPAQDDSDGFVFAPGEEHYIGDVIISYPRALQQAQELGHPVEHEICLLIIHGFLHLLGYDHTSEEEKAAMWGRQAILLPKCLRSQTL